MRIGVLGAGQLGRMLALAGIPLGLEFRFYDPVPNSPASHVSPQICADFDDTASLSQFADGIDVATFEFENVPVQAVEFLQRRVPVHPGPFALQSAQDRLSEKTLFQQLGFKTPHFAPVATIEELRDAVHHCGLPAILKTRRLGYDGKGQFRITTASQVETAWQHVGGVPCILEAMVPFQRELSLLAVRGIGGEMRTYPLVENIHVDGILHRSICPAPNCASGLYAEAAEFAEKLLQALDYVGVLAIELFEADGTLLANEMAPRVHNSGHWSIEGAACSQFENHLRAICGLPLGSTEVAGAASMLNLIGRAPDIRGILAEPGVHLHLYGKLPRPGRKLGHLTTSAHNHESLLAQLAKLEHYAARTTSET
jgi:5-(carboxyamino)imidazole ribonucleotide synthase